MSDMKTALIDMGFPENNVIKALQATSNLSVEAAMEWLLANSDKLNEVNLNQVEAMDQTDANGQTEVEKEKVETNKTEGEEAKGTESSDSVVRSYKCEDCGRILKDATELEYHAAKTGHANFSESTEEKKPLTAEEKAEQLTKLNEKLKQKRIEREEKEKKEALSKEKSRISTGKEILEAKRRLEDQEMKEIAEQRRKDKVDEARARQRVKEQIEADKLARKAKYGGGAESNSITEVKKESSVGVAAGSSTSTESIAVKKDYKLTKLQLRLPSGKALVHTFGVQEPLAAVRLYVELNRDDGLTAPFNLMSNFPKKIYLGEDYDIPLEALGLVPSAVLMVTKSV